MKPNRLWIRLPSGSRLDIINPDPNTWTNRDLSIRLSRTFRWGGDSIWPLPLSVAQHSLAVLELRRIVSGIALAPQDELLELLHDAEEGFLGFDCLPPIKDALGAPYKRISTVISNAIKARYHLSYWTDYTTHECVDLAIMASEAIHCVGLSLHELRFHLDIKYPILDIDPLSNVYGSTPWEPWPADIAAVRYERELNALCDQLHGAL